MELIQRERFEEFQKASHTARLLGILLGADVEALAHAEENLEFAVYQTAWNPTILREKLRESHLVIAKQRQEREADEALLRSAANMSNPKPPTQNPNAPSERGGAVGSGLGPAAHTRRGVTPTWYRGHDG